MLRGKPFRSHVRIYKADFGMVIHETAQTLIVWTKYQLDQPGRCSVIVNRPGIGGVEEPTMLQFHHHAAMTSRMTIQRHQPHLRIERQVDGSKIVPFFAIIIINSPFWSVGDMTTDIRYISPATPRTHKCIIFFAMDMQLGERKIRQTTAVVKVHMGKHDMADIFGLKAEFSNLIESSLLRIKWHIRDDLEQPQHAMRVCIIFPARTRVYQYQTLRSFHQRTDQTCLQPGRRAGIASEAVENMDRHTDMIA